MLELRTEPALPDEAADRLRSIADAANQFDGNPFGLLFGGGGLLADAVALALAEGATRLLAEVFPAGPDYDMLASMGGLTLTRVLLLLRRALPLPPSDDPPLTTRPFRPGTDDEQAWLEVNNRAFEWHPEQSNQTLDDLHRTMAEPWFDPNGFRLHERDGRLAAFCWTKIHEEETPPAGEIYVVGVDPDFQGQGLGRPMTEAGFQWLADAGLTQGLLYTESDNHAALHVYNRMGLRITATRRWYECKLSRDQPRPDE